MNWIELAAYLGTGVLAWLLAGLLGIGGGVIVVPALVWIFSETGPASEWSFRLAVGTSLTILIGTGSTSAYAHHRALGSGPHPGAVAGHRRRDRRGRGRFLEATWLRRSLRAVPGLCGPEHVVQAHPGRGP